MINSLYTIKYLWNKAPRIRCDDTERSYTIAYIHGAGHCGSTLLNMLLNAHSQAIGVSEVENIHDVFLSQHDDEAKRLRNSAFWQQTLDRFEQRAGTPLLIDENRIKLTDWNQYLASPETTVNHLRVVNRALFDSIAEESESVLICDTSKFLLRLHLLIGSGLPIKVIHLHRDGRGVMQSYLRKGHSIHNGFSRWSDAEAGYLLLRHWLPAKDILYCRYENLARHPERELGRICAFLGLNFEQRMLTEFSEVEQIGIGGNRMRLSPGNVITADDAWKRELPAKSRLTFWLMGGWVQWPIQLLANFR